MKEKYKGIFMMLFVIIVVIAFVGGAIYFLRETIIIHIERFRLDPVGWSIRVGSVVILIISVPLAMVYHHQRHDKFKAGLFLTLIIIGLIGLVIGHFLT